MLVDNAKRICALICCCLALQLVVFETVFAQAHCEPGPGCAQCANGEDDDGDGGIDALTTVSSTAGGAELARNDYRAVVNFQRAEARKRGLFTVDGEIAIGHDLDTANILCMFAGYRQADVFECKHSDGRCNYTSPHNNHYLRWNKQLQDFQKVSAESGTKFWISTITCIGRMARCSDGLDNDNDGYIDSDDSGCDSPDDDSELIHDPDCDSLDDDNEGPDKECSDGIDNDGDGKIDYLNDTLPPQRTRSFGGRAPHAMADLVANTIRRKGLPYTAPTAPLVRKVNTTGHGRQWNDDGQFDTATLDKVCEILGYNTHVSSTYLDNDPEYPNGKGNFHSPYNNHHFRFRNGDFVRESAEPKYKKHWLAGITCKDPLTACNDGVDNDNDGKIDGADSGCANEYDRSEIQHDPDCTGPNDDSESPEYACSDGIDNDNDGTVDYPEDPGCQTPDDADEYNECIPHETDTQSCSTGKFGVCEAGVKTRRCRGNGYWTEFGACEQVAQATAEHCSDGLDNDCDGDIDANDSDCFECQPGAVESKSCHTGRPGICEAGNKSRHCKPNGQWSDYGSCEQSHAATGENCSDGIDNDCDGQIDASDSDCYECHPGTTESIACQTGRPGVCDAGTKVRTCSGNGQWNTYGSCQQTTAASAEICNDGRDNDCDGQTDLADSDCYECQPGATESASCSTGKPGVCEAGTKIRTCSATGQWNNYGSCQQNTAASAEVCTDGVDNDCDGLVDLSDSDCFECQPGATESAACSTGQYGVCEAGTQVRTCSANGQWSDYGSCQQNIAASAEICTDGLDNDCDGQVDLSDSDCFECQPGETESAACSTGKFGICEPGTKVRTCGSNGQWNAYGSCSQNETALPIEVCGNGIDNDCDGKIDAEDEDCFECQRESWEERACDSGLPGICQAGKQMRLCSDSGTWNDWSQCGPNHQPGEKAESCDDNIDNDCDGKIDAQDEDCYVCQPGTTETVDCSTGSAGICAAGQRTRTCAANGQWEEYGACTAVNAPQAEQCGDGLDNDCDGRIDAADDDCWACTPGEEELTTCNTGKPGVCEAGKKQRSCGSDGQWSSFGSCDAVTNASAEICDDGQDNDCDGLTDSQDSDCFVCQPGETETVRCDSGAFGVCADGNKQRTCNSNGQWSAYGSCTPKIAPSSQGERCTDGRDNDCDGLVDSEDDDCFTCTPGTTEVVECTTSGFGVCAAGKRSRSCNSLGQWDSFGLCEQTVGPSAEQCSDGIDNDCDGFVDADDEDCMQCTSSDNTEAIRTLDVTAKALSTRLRGLAREYLRLVSSKDDKQWARDVREDASRLSLEGWAAAWRLPQESVDCGNSTLCVSTDYSAAANDFQNVLNQMQAIRVELESRLVEATGRPNMNQFSRVKLGEFDDLHVQSTQALQVVPRTSDVCDL